MESSFLKDDVTLLLKDITGLVKPLSAEEREPLIQSGTHYSEMLPLEYKPSDKYIEAYYASFQEGVEKVAGAVKVLAEKIYREKNNNITLVSLARAGIPLGIILKRYFKYRYNLDISHYAISIIRGKGIDKNAIDYIISKHSEESIVFVDGWTGKGAIQKELSTAMKDYPNIDDRLAVIADPANITSLAGTYEDILIPSSCLNSTVSGLISRTFLRNDIISPDDFHGAAYYGELKDEDKTYEFIDGVCNCFGKDIKLSSKTLKVSGVEEVESICHHFGISDINLVKPGIGETTRVLLRRVPWKVLVAEWAEGADIEHIYRLAEERNIPVEKYPLNNYKVCGIIKQMADI